MALLLLALTLVELMLVALCQSNKWHKVWAQCQISVILKESNNHTKGTQPMRKIETQMVNAIENNLDWHSANTVVEYINGISVVKLHGHKIAEVGDSFIRLFDGGYQTTTTKSRLNAILKGCGLPGECVFAKQFEWFINIKFHEITTVPFFSGMRIH